MNRFMKMAMRFLIAIVLTTAASAQMPQKLTGLWRLNVPATKKYMKTSSRWKGMDEQYLLMILNKMDQMKYTFTENAIIVTMQGKRQTFPVSLKKSVTVHGLYK